MRLHYRTIVKGKMDDVWHEDIEDQGDAFTTAFAILAERTVTRPVPEVEIYDDTGHFIFLIRANTYSDGQQDYIVTPQKGDRLG